MPENCGHKFINQVGETSHQNGGNCLQKGGALLWLRRKNKMEEEENGVMSPLVVSAVDVNDADRLKQK